MMQITYSMPYSVAAIVRFVNKFTFSSNYLENKIECKPKPVMPIYWLVPKYCLCYELINAISTLDRVLLV